MPRSLRETVKPFVPSPLRKSAAKALNVGRRISGWLYVFRNVKGVSADDQSVLRASYASAPKDIVSNLSDWRDPRLIADATIVVNGMGRFAVRGHSDDFGHVLAKEHVEILEVINTRVGRGDTVIDAGANIGSLTVAMGRKVGASGTVLAVEMMPDTASCLRQNIELNAMSGHVTVFEKALSAKAGELVTARVAEGFFGQASIAESANSGRAVRDISVPTTTLDDVAGDCGDIALIKLDLEGAEPIALRGAARTLRKTRLVAFESWSGDDGETARILTDAGFSISRIDPRNFLAERKTQ